MSKGTVYLLHLSEPLAGRSSHYIGWARDDVQKRIAQHGTALGSPMLAAAKERGISWVLARTWEGPRAKERELKNRKQARSLCPFCEDEFRRADRLYKRTKWREKKQLAEEAMATAIGYEPAPIH